MNIKPFSQGKPSNHVKCWCWCFYYYIKPPFPEQTYDKPLDLEEKKKIKTKTQFSSSSMSTKFSNCLRMSTPSHLVSSHSDPEWNQDRLCPQRLILASRKGSKTWVQWGKATLQPLNQSTSAAMLEVEEYGPCELYFKI